MAVLTVSRQFGAGGKTLAEKVAKKLEYSIATEEIVEHLAESAKVSPEKLSSFETEQNFLARPESGIMTPKRFIEHLRDPNRKYMEGALYVKLLGKILPKIAEKDKTIIVGRGAQFILKGVPRVYHVLLLAPEEFRIRFMVDAYDLTIPEARKLIHRQEKRRAALMRLFYHEDYNQPWHYDMTLNMAKLQMDRAVELVCDLLEP